MRRGSVIAVPAACLALAIAPAGAAAAWSAPQVVSDPAVDAINPRVGIDASGAAFAGFPAPLGLGRIAAAQRPAGGTFAPPRIVFDSPLDGTAYDGAIAARGDAVLLTVRTRKPYSRVRAALAGPDGTLGAARTISVRGHTARSPVVAMDRSGWAVAAWYQYDGAAWHVAAAVKPPGDAFGAPRLVSAAYRRGAIWTVSPGVDGRGRALVAWQTERRVQAAAGDQNGFSAPAALGADAIGPLVVALGDRGDALVAWHAGTARGTQPSVLTVARRPPGDPIAPGAPLAGAPRVSGAHSIGAAFDTAGRGVLLQLVDPGADESSLSAYALAPDGTTGPPMQLDAGVGYETPVAAFDGAGRATALWAAGGDIRTAERDAAGTWGAAQTLSDPSHRTGSPRLAVNPSGAAVAGWIWSVPGAPGRVEVSVRDR